MNTTTFDDNRFKVRISEGSVIAQEEVFRIEKLIAWLRHELSMANNSIQYFNNIIQYRDRLIEQTQKEVISKIETIYELEKRCKELESQPKTKTKKRI